MIFFKKRENRSDDPKTEKTEAEWRESLTPEEYRVLRKKGTEAPFTGTYWNHHADGTYTCAACGQELFDSEAKFDSGCGWPSFYIAKDEGHVKFIEDDTHGMSRIEVVCSACEGHLGHIFPDGPPPTGQRYCINSVSIKFKQSE